MEKAIGVITIAFGVTALARDGHGDPSPDPRIRDGAGGSRPGDPQREVLAGQFLFGLVNSCQLQTVCNVSGREVVFSYFVFDHPFNYVVHLSNLSTISFKASAIAAI